MKNFLFVALLLSITCSLAAQENKQSKEERIKALKIAFISDELELTPEVSESFWPIYNAHEKRESEIRALGRPTKIVEDMTEEEASAFITARLNAESELLELNRKYVHDVKGVITDKQLARLFLIDREFKRKMLENIRAKRKGEQKKKMKQ